MSEIDVLVIEDDKVDYTTLKKLFEKMKNFSIKSHHVTKISDGLKLAQDENFDAIFLDLNLPDAKGFEGVLKLTHLIYKVPVIILSVTFDREIYRKALILGCQEYLEKGSVTPEILDRTLTASVSRKNHEQNILKSESERTSFSNSVIHELRTPLNGIIGFSELLLDETEFDRESVRRILECGNHMVALVDDLLDLAKFETGDIRVENKPTNLHSLISDCCNTVSAKYHEDSSSLFIIDIDKNVPEKPCIDPFRNRQILLNFLSNAQKFNLTGKIKVQVTQKEHMIYFHIQDNGHGICQEISEKIFEPFFQGKAPVKPGAQKGTGLGLSVNKLLVEIMGGAIGVESKVGSGSTFWYSIPGSPTILLVDDESDIRQFIKHLLEDSRYRVLEANDGIPALEIFKNEKPDLVVSDINMPKMNGIELSEEILKIDKSAKIIITSGIDVYKVPDKNSGVAKFFGKPLDYEFANYVKEILST